MINSRKLITLILSTAVLLAACQNSSEDANPESGDKTPRTTYNESGKSPSQANPSDHAADSPSEGNSGAAEHSKDQYLQELNKMEEEDRNEAAGTTMVELEQQEAARYKKWDQKLNEIYGVLKERLSAEQMDQLRKDQQNWIQQRDETAKQSSLKYEGGSSEKLEYAATQAALTRERCYTLVAQYMK